MNDYRKAISPVNWARQDYAWEWAADKEANASVLVLRDGDQFFIGFDVPSPDSPVFERTMLKPHSMPDGQKFGPHYAKELLMKYIDFRTTDPLRVMQCQLS